MKKALIVLIAVSASLWFCSRGECRTFHRGSHLSSDHGLISHIRYESTSSTEQPDLAADRPVNGTELSQWALVLIGIITCAVVGWQAYESRRGVIIAQKTMVAQFRPRVAIRSIQLDDTARPKKIIIRLVNQGSTNAYIVGGSTGLRSINEWEKDDPDWIARGLVLGGSAINAGEEKDIEEISLNENLQWAVASNAASNSHYSTAIVCSGEIRYRDDNEVIRTLGFYRTFNWTTKRFIPSDDPGKEYCD